MAAGRTLHHLIDNMGFFDVGVELEPGNSVQVLNTNDIFAGNGIALFIENNVEDHSLLGLEYALTEIDAEPVILLIGMAEYGDVAHGISAQCFVGRYWNPAFVKLENSLH